MPPDGPNFGRSSGGMMSIFAFLRQLSSKFTVFYQKELKILQILAAQRQFLRHTKILSQILDISDFGSSKSRGGFPAAEYPDICKHVYILSMIAGFQKGCLQKCWYDVKIGAARQKIEGFLVLFDKKQ